MATPEVNHLYQLCRLDIPGALLAVALFEELKNSIRCEAITLLWWQSEPSIARGYYESETDVNCAVAEVETFKPIFSGTGPELFSLLNPAHPMLKEIAGVLPGVQHVVDQNFATLVAYLTHAGKRIGAILLHRPCMQPFSTAEKAALVRWTPTLADALTRDTGQCQFITRESNAGILLVDSDMKIQSACSHGRKLIHLANASDRNETWANRGDDLGSKRRADFHTQDWASAKDFIVRNGWGSFQFRLHRLSDSTIHPNSLTAIAVHPQEPLILSAFRGCHDLSLSEKQTEICLLLTKGLSYEAAASKLCIKSTTVVDHVRKIYDKVGVGNRSELVTTLLLGAKKSKAYCPSMRRLSGLKAQYQ